MDKKLNFQIWKRSSVLAISLLKNWMEVKFEQLNENLISYNFARNSLVRILTFTMPKSSCNMSLKLLLN